MGWLGFKQTPLGLRFTHRPLGHCASTNTFKGELNAKTNVFLFESVGKWITSVKFFLKLKPNYIEKLNIETKKTL